MIPLEARNYVMTNVGNIMEVGVLEWTARCPACGQDCTWRKAAYPSKSIYRFDCPNCDAQELAA